MSRLVVPKRKRTGLWSQDAVNESQSDDYKDRLLKYVPIESVAFYTAVDKIVASHYKIVAGAPLPTDLPSEASVVGWSLIGLGAVGTIVYLWRARSEGQPWLLNVTLATVAFVCWAYTLGGTGFAVSGLYDVFVASLLAPIFTFAAGFLSPRAQVPAPHASVARAQDAEDPTALANAVSISIEEQLKHDRKWPPIDLTRIMRDDYKYDRLTMPNFLGEVLEKLKQKTGHSFPINNAFVLKVLPMSVGELGAAITTAAT